MRIPLSALIAVDGIFVLITLSVKLGKCLLISKQEINCGHKKTFGVSTKGFVLSGRQDSNLRPPGPKPDALPACATPRFNPAELNEPHQR